MCFGEPLTLRDHFVIFSLSLPINITFMDDLVAPDTPQRLIVSWRSLTTMSTSPPVVSVHFTANMYKALCHTQSLCGC